MRPFTLKKTITQATVLTALLPSAAVLSQQVHAPIGLNGKITISAGATAIMGHEVVPAGLAPMDPKSAPARGGYVYDNFNTVVRTGVTRECVKHGLWSPELATPDCEPWLFATPPAPKAAEPAAAPAPAPTAEAKPTPTPKEEGFPEWMGPDEANMGIAPIWPQSNLEPDDNIGLPRMYFDGDEVADEQADDLIGAPVMHGDADEYTADEAELVSPPVVYYEDEDAGKAGDDLISAPRQYEEEVIAQPIEDQWPKDPYAESQPAEEAADVGSNDAWMPEPRDDQAATAPSGTMEFKEEESWPIDKFAQGFVEEQSVVEPDSSWVIPNPIPEGPVDPMIGHYQEDGKEPEEAISNPVMVFDAEDGGIEPGETISSPVMAYDAGADDAGFGSDPYVSEPRMFHDEDDAQVPSDGLISDARQYSTDDQPEPTPEPQSAAAPYESRFEEKPFPEVTAVDEPEGKPFNAEFPSGDGSAAPATQAAAAPTQPAATDDASPSEDDDDDDGDYRPDYSNTLTARDASADLPLGTTPTAPQATAPAPSAEEPAEEEDEPEEPFVPDYSKVATAEGALDNLPYPSAAAPAPSAPPAKPAPVAAAEEHLMTVVLSADALFDFDRYVMKPSARKSLDEFVAAVKEIKWGQIQVVGHTDRLGSAKYNQRLSERRAQAVRKQLISRGLDGRKIKAIGKGKTQPVTTDCVGEKRSKELITCLQPDRRVEIFVDEKRDVQVPRPAKPK